MDWIISTYMGSKGARAISSAQSFLSGKKTYIAALVAGVTALANLLNQFSSLSSTISTIDWLRHLTGNSDALILWHSILACTGRAAISKAAGPDPVINSKDGP